MHRANIWLMGLLGLFLTVGLNLGLTPTAEAQIVFPERARVVPTTNDPGRRKLGNASKISKDLFAKPKGARGKAKRKPKKYKKLTISDFKKFVGKAAKKKGARGKTNKKAQALLKRLEKGGKIIIEKPAWAEPGKAKKGSRGRKGPKTVKKELSQEEYLAEINKLEKQANAQGYSLLEDDSDVAASSFVSNKNMLRQQANALNRKGWSKVRPLDMPKKPRFASVKMKKGARGKAKKSRLRMLTSKNSFRVKKPKKGARGARGAKKGKPIKLYKKEMKDSVTYGSKKTASVGFGYRFFTKIDMAGAKADASVNGTVHLFKKKFDIFRAEAKMSGKVKGKSTKAKLTLNVIGIDKITVFDHDSTKKGSRGKKKALWSKGDRKAYEKEISHKIHFVIAFIPVNIEVGAAFAAGVEYKVSLNPTSVSAEVSPFINADGFARFAVNLLIVEAGIEGRITLLDLELRLLGEGGVSMDDKKGAYAYAYFAGDLALEALSGSLSVFVKVNLLIWKKKFSHTIFRWKGLSKTWRLFELRDEKALFGGTEEQKAAAKKNTGPSKAVTENPCPEGVRGIKAKYKNFCIIDLPQQIGKDCSRTKCDRYRFVSQNGKRTGMIAYASKSRRKVFKRIYECKEGEQRSRAKNSKFDGLNKNSWCILWSGKLKNGKRLKHANKCPGKYCPYILDHRGLLVPLKKKSKGKTKKAKTRKKAQRHGAPKGIYLKKKKSNSTTWILESSNKKGWVRLKSRATGKYLHNERGRIELGTIKKTWLSALWKLEPSPAHKKGYVYLKNRWKQDRFLHAQFGMVEATNVEDPGWWSAMWRIENAGKDGQFRFKNRWKKTYLSSSK